MIIITSNQNGGCHCNRIRRLKREIDCYLHKHETGDENGDEMGSNSTPTGSRVSFYRLALGSAGQKGSRVSFAGAQRGRWPTATARMLVCQLLCIRGMKMNLEVRQTNSNKIISHSES